MEIRIIMKQIFTKIHAPQHAQKVEMHALAIKCACVLLCLLCAFVCMDLHENLCIGVIYDLMSFKFYKDSRLHCG